MPPPLVCPATSFVNDPLLADTVDVERPPLHSPTTGPNRYTIHVPTETTRLSLGEKSGRWNTDVGITGYTDSHIHFETKANDKTVMSLGTPATVSLTGGHGSPQAPIATHGYSMVTQVNAWYEAKKQHYWLSQLGDISLRTRGPDKRAVIQADHGYVNLNGGKEVNVSGGGVSIGAAEELELEDVVYAGHWEGHRPHSTAGGAGRIGLAIAAAVMGLHDLVANKKRKKFEPGKFAGAADEFGDKHKRKINSLLFALAMNKVVSLVRAPEAPAQCIKLDAQKNLAAIAGREVGFYGNIGASLGSAMWTTVSAGVSAGLKGLVFAGVGGTFVAAKGLRKAEVSSDYGRVFIGAEGHIHMNGEKDFTASAAKVAHVAANGAHGTALFGGDERAWIGTKAGPGWGMLLDKEGIAIGSAGGAAEMATASIKPHVALRVTKDKIELKGGPRSTLTLDKNFDLQAPQIRFKAKTGECTVNGAGMILLK